MSDLVLKIEKSCALCKFAKLDEQLDDEALVLCTVNPSNPCTKDVGDTCLKHTPRYKNLKVIVEKDHLMEYDTEGKNVPSPTSIPNTRTIGESEWQQ